MNSKDKISLPPGPWGLPLVGNLPFLDSQLHRCFAQLAVKYGPVLKVQLGSKTCIIITSPEAAKQVLKDHDTNFSDHDIPIAGVVCEYGGLGMLTAPYGEHWSMMRKVCVSGLLSHGSLDAFYDLRSRAVRDMVRKVHSRIRSPIDIGEHVLLAMFTMITSMMWGNSLDADEELRVMANYREFLQKVADLLDKPNISDFFPMLAQFDIQGKEREAKEVLMWFDQIFESVIDKYREKDTGEDEENKYFLQVLLQLIDRKDQRIPFTVTDIKAFFLDMIIAGTKTTSTTVEWAMAELLNHPEIMSKAKDELEQVVGINNVLEETHLSQLPYLDAIVKEVMRLHPVIPLLVPRCPRESRIVGGYLIPKGAKVFVNAWAIQRDPKYWNEPLMFQPERFSNSSVNWDYKGNDFRYLPFGSRRRRCAGVTLAEKVIPYLLGSLLHSFDWALPEGTALELTEIFGLEMRKKIPLVAVPSPRSDE